MKLRQWQIDTLSRVKLLNTGDRLLVQAPTGAGKLLLLQHIAKLYLDLGKTVLAMVDRIELINDMKNSRDGIGLNYDIHTTQTIGRRDVAKNYDVILIDEAHVKPSNVIKQIINQKNIIIGLTATALSKGLGKIYGKQAYVPTTFQEMVELDLLMQPTFLVNDNLIDTSKLKTKTNGEYEIGDMVLDNVILGDINKLIEKHLVNNHQCMILAPNQKEAVRIKNEINIPSAIYVSDLKEGFDEFKLGNIKVVITVYALSKGFNHPNISLILDCRPLRNSVIEFIQGLGRGTRIMNGKTESKYIDMCGNYFRFEQKYIKWRISKFVKLDTKSKSCVNCDHDYLKQSLPPKCTAGEHLTYNEMKCVNKKCFVDFITEDMINCPACNVDFSHECIECHNKVNICNRICPNCFSPNFKERPKTIKDKQLLQKIPCSISDFKQIKADYTALHKMTKPQLAWSILETAYYYAVSRGKHPIKSGAMYAFVVIKNIWTDKVIGDVYKSFYTNVDYISSGNFNVNVLELIKKELARYARERNTTRSV